MLSAHDTLHLKPYGLLTVVRLVSAAVPQVKKLRKKLCYPQATPEALLFFYVAD
jgi:hypothetical protein